jgi:hypothetical protein
MRLLSAPVAACMVHDRLQMSTTVITEPTAHSVVKAVIAVWITALGTGVANGGAA